MINHPNRSKRPASLTDDDLDLFRAASAMVWQGLTPGSLTDLLEEAPMSRAEVVRTHETYSDFTRAHGTASVSRTVHGHEIHMWKGVQFRKGQTRGCLFLMEFDHGQNASYFLG